MTPLRTARPGNTDQSPGDRGRRRRRIGLAAFGAAAALVLAPASPAAATTGSISGHSACRAGYANTSSTFSVGMDTEALTARAVYYGYQGQTLAYSSFIRFGSTYANFKRSASATWSNGNVSDVYWVWWEGTPETGLTLLNHIHVDCNT